MSKHQCKYCSKRFIKRARLNRHLLEDHADEVADSFAEKREEVGLPPST